MVEQYGRDVLMDSSFLHNLCHRPQAALESLQAFARGDVVQPDKGRLSSPAGLDAHLECAPLCILVTQFSHFTHCIIQSQGQQ